MRQPHEPPTPDAERQRRLGLTPWPPEPFALVERSPGYFARQHLLEQANWVDWG